jgi:DNA-binding MarR family transcriptional regulator
MKQPERLLDILRDNFVSLVRSDDRDLSVCQLAVLLVCCLDDRPHTMHGLAEWLNVSRPAATRAADRLVELGLVKRADNPNDRRGVLLVATVSGRAFVKGLRAMIAACRHLRSPSPPEATGDRVFTQPGTTADIA